jgi:CysZ protein
MSNTDGPQPEGCGPCTSDFARVFPLLSFLSLWLKSGHGSIAGSGSYRRRPQGSTACFREGLLAPWEGFRFMNRNPRLWQFGILPVFLNLLITVLVLALLISGGVWYAQTMHPRLRRVGGKRGLEVLVILALFVGIVAIALAVWLLLQSILCGYFYGKLARQVELQLGMRPEDMKEVSFAREVLDGIRDVTVLLAVNAALLLLHIIPVVGSVVAVAGSLYFDSWVLGLDYFEYPLGLRGKTRREMRQFCKAHRPQTLGSARPCFCWLCCR